MKKVNSLVKGQIVLITGASTGIGRETAYKFASEGSRLIITYYKNLAEAKRVKTKCLNIGAKSVQIVHLDVQNDQSIKKAENEIENTQKNIDILINNAGVIYWKKFTDQTNGEIEAQLRTNLEGLIKFTKIMLPMIKDTIINISSGAGRHAYADLTVYCATKFGVRGFTQALSQEQPGLNIYCVNPTLTATQMTNFTGMDPKLVAEVILKTAKNEYAVEPGGDINVWEKIS
jgi:short-subunit dehydrogenase